MSLTHSKCLRATPSLVRATTCVVMASCLSGVMAPCAYAGLVNATATAFNYTSYAYDGTQLDEADKLITGNGSPAVNTASITQNGSSSSTILTFGTQSITLGYAQSDTSTQGSYAGSGATDNDGNVTDSIVFQVTLPVN